MAVWASDSSRGATRLGRAASGIGSANAARVDSNTTQPNASPTLPHRAATRNPSTGSTAARSQATLSRLRSNRSATAPVTGTSRNIGSDWAAKISAGAPGLPVRS
jgi:hypothetical protein